MGGLGVGDSSEKRGEIVGGGWVGGEAGGQPKYAYACYGVSPFAMLDLSDDIIANMDLTASFLCKLSAVTLKDLKSSKVRLVATVPMDGF